MSIEEDMRIKKRYNITLTPELVDKITPITEAMGYKSLSAYLDDHLRNLLSFIDSAPVKFQDPADMTLKQILTLAQYAATEPKMKKK